MTVGFLILASVALCGVPNGPWGLERAPWWKGVPPSVRASVVLDGKPVLATDDTWRVYDSPIVIAAMRCGEFYDARRDGHRTNEGQRVPGTCDRVPLLHTENGG